MGRKSISNVVAGGLITGATVMGVDALTNAAEATPMVATQSANFEFVFNDDALTCCYDTPGLQEFIFDGFDPALGDLLTADLSITFDGLASQGLTCCYDLTDVVAFGGTLAGFDLTNAMVRDLADGVASIALDVSGIGAGVQTLAMNFNIEFADGSVSLIGAPQGALALNYTYEAASIPGPATIALVAPWVVAPFASAALRRRRKDS